MEEALISNGLKVRRMGRVMRVTIEDENTIDRIISTAAKSEVQIRELREYEPDAGRYFPLDYGQIRS